METKKHSGFGIASFITSIVSAILIFILMLFAGFIAASSPGGMDQSSTAAVIVGLFLIAFLFLSLVALGLGIVGLFQKKRKKIFSVLGTIFSAVTIICAVSVMIIGITMS